MSVRNSIPLKCYVAVYINTICMLDRYLNHKYQAIAMKLNTQHCCSE